MPELPEVETVKNELTPHILGRTITGVDFLWEGHVKEPSPEEFRGGVTGKKALSLARRGKYIIIALSSGKYLIVHLKMTGSLLVGEEGDELPKYTRTVFHLDDGRVIFFRDPRKFGALRLVDDPDRIVGKLGPEPLKDDFTPEVLAERLGKRSAPIKAVLCDQNVIAGLGSMYADEVLFANKIHPMRTPVSLTKKEIKGLHGSIRETLWEAIENKGASVDTYYRPDGSRGTAHYRFKVAHRYKEPCPVCGTPVERIRVRGRGSYFCPKCQKLKR